MKKHSVAICLLTFICFLPGCTTFWYQEGKTISQCKEDRRQCYGELVKFSTLQNMGDYEFKFIKDCMGKRGYKPVPENKLPLRVRRMEPASSIHWRLRGVAGTFDR
ncbi:MAG: hypothetical protein ACYTFK_09450 [Planctomycetota bacterium]